MASVVESDGEQGQESVDEGSLRSTRSGPSTTESHQQRNTTVNRTMQRNINTEVDIRQRRREKEKEDQQQQHILPQRPPRERSVYVIREIYNSENAYELFEHQLEQALTQKTDTIIIEPPSLGDETARWIGVGNWLHKTAVIAGFGSMLAAFVWPNRPIIFVPASILSTVCTSVYSLCWQCDPCCQYQLGNSGEILAGVHNLTSSSPVVLVRKDDSRRRILHTAVTVACLGQTAMRMYFPYISNWMGRPSSPKLLGGASIGIGNGNENLDLVISNLHDSTPGSGSVPLIPASFIGGLFRRGDSSGVL